VTWPEWILWCLKNRRDLIVQPADERRYWERIRQEANTPAKAKVSGAAASAGAPLFEKPRR
jgi:hypothetical protein